MRASIIIASHNEGDLLANTIESCVETTAGMDYEIIVADDASSDGSAEAAVQRSRSPCGFRRVCSMLFYG
jgi:glycosyltransferase involved in cell wall biosynthesis